MSTCLAREPARAGVSRLVIDRLNKANKLKQRQVNLSAVGPSNWNPSLCLLLDELLLPRKPKQFSRFMFQLSQPLEPLVLARRGGSARGLVLMESQTLFCGMNHATRVNEHNDDD